LYRVLVNIANKDEHFDDVGPDFSNNCVGKYITNPQKYHGAKRTNINVE
jgi:hypothetical protein